MKKRFIAFAVVLSLMLSTVVYAGYYPENIERPQLTFEQMAEQEFDFEKTISELSQILTLIENNAPEEEILSRFNSALPEDSIDAQTRYYICSILTSADNSGENNALLTRVTQDTLDIDQLTLSIIKKLYESDYKTGLITSLGVTEDQINELIESMPGDREYEISKELAALNEEYYSSVFGTHKMEFEGKEYDIYSLNEIPEEDLPKQFVRYILESRDILSDIFIRIVEKRLELSEAAGYDSYADYAYTEEYPKDYTREDIQAFYKYIAEYIVPVYKDILTILDLWQDSSTNNIRVESEEELLELMRTSLEGIHPELTYAFDYMQKYRLYDISLSDKKRPGAFTTELPYFRVPYVFVNPEGSYDTMLSSTVHEFGHFNALFHSPELTIPGYLGEVPLNLDVAEIHSQGLELLFLEDYGRYYGSGAVYNRYCTLADLLYALITSGVYSMWLEEVYSLAKTTTLTADILCDTLGEVYKTFGVEGLMNTTGANCEWMMISHHFEVPFYYISYGVSVMAALELFAISGQDRDDAIDRYMKLSAKGTQVLFRQTTDSVGLSDTFAESTFHMVAQSLTEYTGLSYNDVEPEDWFFPYVTLTAGFLDAPSPDTFDPKSAATRLTFVEALGRMEDDINPITTTRHTFTDTKSHLVSWAADNGIVAGITENRFGAELAVTREQVVCFLYRMAGEPDISDTPDFTDSGHISAWAADAVAWAQNEGIVSGYTDNSFRPKNNVTRAETAKLIADAYKTYY